MKFEIRRVRNGAVLRVELNELDEEPEEIVYQETEEDEVKVSSLFQGFKKGKC